MAEAEDDELDELTLSLRSNRPAGPEASSLEHRLAIASILSASGHAAKPTRLGRLELQSRIGGGTMGVVYRAWDPELERTVAVKLLRASGDEERALIAGEARALARLNHPHVVAVHDIIDSAGELSLVMEYVPGSTLREWLAAHPSASWREVLSWFVQAGRGVVAAHGAGLVHQDLKPDNVLVGDDGRARVVDFGLARLHAQPEDEGIAGGTTHYMAPEVSAAHPATQRSDQYSFCLSLREALAERSPPAALDRVIERGLATAPLDRFESFEALLARLERVLEPAETDHARALLLERVDRLWLRGVLERSLDGASAIDVQLVEDAELVRPPWKDWAAEQEAGGVHRAHELQDLFATSHGALLITGPPGSGKTTALLSLCRALWHAASADPAEPPPVVLSLSTYEPEERAGHSLSDHFSRWVATELVAKYGLPRPAVERWVEGAGVALLLDGLDETAPDRREQVVESLNAFREEHPLGVVVTCRDTEYEALSLRLAFGRAVRLQPLDDDGIAKLLETRHAAKLLGSVADNVQLREHLRNPLLLTLLAGGDGLDDDDDAPVWARAYERYLGHALEGADSDEERARLRAQLSTLASTMRAFNIADLWLERLHFRWLPRLWERVGAYGMGVVLVFVFGVGVNLIQVPLTGNPLPSALTFGLGVSISSFLYTRGRIKPVETLRWSWQRMLRLLPITTLCAAVVGLAEALRVNFAANLLGAAITGAMLAVTFGFDASDRASKVRPNAGIRRSLGFALATSFGFGVPAGLVFGFIVEPWLRQPLVLVNDTGGNPALMGGVTVGMFVFTALFLIYGGFTVLMHYVLRAWLAWRTPLPFDLQGLLDRAVQLGLMRRVGGGYVFLHRTLLDYFADRSGERA